MEEDIGQRIIDKLENLNVSLEDKMRKLKRNGEPPIQEGKKNSHLHINIETETLERMKKEAEAEKISLAEWCRRKLRGDSQLDRIEGKLDRVLGKD